MRKHAHRGDPRKTSRAGLRWGVPTLFSATRPMSLGRGLLKRGHVGTRLLWLRLDISSGERCAGVHVALSVCQRLALGATLRMERLKWRCYRYRGRRSFRRTRHPQMEARMMAADTVRRARAAWAMLDAVLVQFGAAFVPELITSAVSDRCIAIVAGPIGERWPRRRCSIG